MDISIIVPIYNAEKTLKRTLDALKAQTLEKIEILLIDNGSIDKSGEICQKYAQEDIRFQYFFLEHKGVSAARNFGLDQAKGTYICFCDADDVPYETMFLILYNDILHYQTDCVMCNYYSERDERESKFPKKLHNLLNGSEIKNNFVPNMFASDKGEDIIWGTVWRGIFKKKMIEINQLRFDEKLGFAEDLCFVIGYLSACKSLYLEEACLYRYSLTADSLMLSHRHYHSRMFEERCQLIAHLKKILSDIGLYKQYRNLIDNVFHEYILDCVGNATTKSVDNSIKKAYKLLKEIVNDPLVTELFREIHTNTAKRRIVYFLIKRKFCLMLLLYYRSRRRGD